MSERDSGLKTLLGASDEGSQPTRSAAIAQIAFERIGLFAAAFGFALLLIKIVRVSHLNGRTAHALLTTVGPVEILLGTLVTHFPSVLFAISLLVVWWASGSLAKLRTLTPGHAAAGAVLVFAVMLLPWPFLVVLAVVGAGRFFRGSSEEPARGGAAGYYLLVGAVAIILIADSEPWLPPEVFTVSDGSQILGFALEEAENSTGWVVVLTDDDRVVIRLRQDEILARRPCHPEEEHLELETFPSLLQVAIRESVDLPEPECPA